MSGWQGHLVVLLWLLTEVELQLVGMKRSLWTAWETPVWTEHAHLGWSRVEPLPAWGGYSAVGAPWQPLTPDLGKTHFALCSQQKTGNCP